MNISKLTALRFSIIAITCFAIPADAGLITGLDSEHLALADEHPYVGWYEVDDGVNGTTFGASGVLIDPHWVLMSAHGALSVDNDLSSTYDSFRFGFGPNFNTNRGENMLASELFLHPSYRDVGTGYDLALLRFDSPFETVTPINRFRGNVVAGAQGDIVGFGRLETQGSTDQALTGDRRAGTDLIETVGAFPVSPEQFMIRVDGRFGGPSYNLLQMKGTKGDSGGGWIVGEDLWGITSNAASTITAFSKLDNEWIDTTMANNPVSGVPEPSALLLLSTVLPIAIFIKRRRTRRACHHV
ncbi:Trypsin [Novipirellula aureliae]|uniref:Trypsin n=1 Tax=Novipirellula aureliae TaxID=2527966 RepID=A0A5C6DP98_9BACT|nr:trypsin-like serine protease [Novipirellula aureliae]TWU37471.1 Trypsin [Novipirellula aureliae]